LKGCSHSADEGGSVTFVGYFIQSINEEENAAFGQCTVYDFDEDFGMPPNRLAFRKSF
jgi:hypothetical protein